MINQRISLQTGADRIHQAVRSLLSSPYGRVVAQRRLANEHVSFLEKFNVEKVELQASIRA